MYICQMCKNVQGPNQSPTKVVLATRERKYENKVKVKMGARNVDRYINSVGFEIVKEVLACRSCTPKPSEAAGV